MFRALTKSADSEKVLEFLKLAGAEYLKKVEAEEESLHKAFRRFKPQQSKP